MNKRRRYFASYLSITHLWWREPKKRESRLEQLCKKCNIIRWDPAESVNQLFRVSVEFSYVEFRLTNAILSSQVEPLFQSYLSQYTVWDPSQKLSETKFFSLSFSRRVRLPLNIVHWWWENVLEVQGWPFQERSLNIPLGRDVQSPIKLTPD